MAQDVDGFKARWVRTSVEMLEHPIFEGDEYCPRAAWLWLIANAAWKPRKFRPAGVNAMVELKRGEVLVGREFLAKTWGWSEKKVRNFLALLQSENMIKMGQSKGRYANVATICNYEKYQSAGPVEGQLEDGLRAGCGPVEGQTLTKNTNTTTSTSSEVARANAPAPAALPDRFMDRMIEAAGDCLANQCNAQGLLTEATPMMWLENGCDFERDVLPTLRAAAVKHKGKRISTWAYFTPMIAEARAKRLAGLPAVSLQKPTASAYLPTPKRRELTDEERERIAAEMNAL